MDHFGILKRAVRITWDYKLLWIFGFILALTSGGGGGSGGGGNTGNWPGNAPRPDQLPRIEPALIIGVVVTCCLLLIVLTVIGIIAHFVARTALIRLVDEYERTGQKRRFREAWRLGWDRRTFRLFVMNFIVILPLVLFFVAAALVATAPLLLWTTRVTGLGVLGTVIAVGLIFLVVIVGIVVGFLIMPWLELAQREVVLREQGVVAALTQAWAILRRRTLDTYIMALLLTAVNWGMIFVMLPLFIISLIIAALVAGLPALLVGGLVYALAGQQAALIAGAVVALPLFILALAIPLGFVAGIVQVFYSSTWTLTYRELVLPTETENADSAAPAAEEAADEASAVSPEAEGNSHEAVL